MALKTKVKVTNITNLSDARYCSGMGVDLLGFPVGSVSVESDLKQMKDIAAWVSGPTLVLEWSGADFPKDLFTTLSSYNVGLLEFNASMLESLPIFDIPVIVTLDIAEWDTLKDLIRKSKNTIEYLQLTSLSADSIPDFQKIDLIAKEFDVLLAYGIKESIIDQILSHSVTGISLAGGHEDKPGLKEYSLLADILEKLEID